MGSLDYMAPEQAVSSHDVDPRADQYSLGCTLFEFLTGRPPFSGPKYDLPIKTGLAHLHELPPPLVEFRPDAPDGLAAIMARMLVKDRADRYPTPADVAEALLPYSAGSDLSRLLARILNRADLRSSSEIAERPTVAAETLCPPPARGRSEAGSTARPRNAG
jgi:serine/threonine protein kinase